MKTVLVCDDDVAILKSIEIYLKMEGYNVILTENGKEALSALENNEVHCIILDIMMPVLDGLNATLKIRESLNIPIILLSAKSEDTDKITGLGFGADDYVTKPFNPLEVVARVRGQLRRAKAYNPAMNGDLPKEEEFAVEDYAIAVAKENKEYLKLKKQIIKDVCERIKDLAGDYFDVHYCEICGETAYQDVILKSFDNNVPCQIL